MKTIGFAAPKSESAHHFRLDHTLDGVELAEVAGYLERGIPRAWPRARLPLSVWALVAGDVRDELNKRITSADPRTPPGDWAAHHAEAARGATAATAATALTACWARS